VSQLPQRGVVKIVTVLAAGFALGGIGIASWYIFGQSQPVPWVKPAAIDGATVRLTYEGSACRDSADAGSHHGQRNRSREVLHRQRRSLPR
jgi:hypothetical protein